MFTSSINVDVKRKEVWLCDLTGAAASEQQGLRPCVVCSNEICNRFSPTITIVPITSKLKKNLPTHTFLKADIHGFDVDSVATAEQVRVLDKGRLITKLLVLDDITMKKIDRTVALQVGINYDEEVYA